MKGTCCSFEVSACLRSPVQCISETLPRPWGHHHICSVGVQAAFPYPAFLLQFLGWVQERRRPKVALPMRGGFAAAAFGPGPAPQGNGWLRVRWSWWERACQGAHFGSRPALGRHGGFRNRDISSRTSEQDQKPLGSVGHKVEHTLRSW